MCCWIAMLLVIIASPAQDPGQAPSAPDVTVESLYCGVNQPVMIEAAAPRSFGKLRLALMDFHGKPLADNADVYPGRIDLAEVFPSIWRLEKAAYVQVLDGSVPVGAAVVVQPLRSRMVPMTQVQAHPVTGRSHSRIVGWKDENDPLLQSPATQPSKADSVLPPPRLTSGVRVYLELDVVLHTQHGEIRLAMCPNEAPNTAWNFLELVGGGFYRGVTFHRIVPFTAAGHPFVIQAGDPTGTGDGGPGYWLPLEPSALPHDFGVISMARADHPDSAGSQFFICLSREGTARLDGQYCSFGYAVSGTDAIKAIAETELADVAAGRPVKPPVIERAELVPAPPRTPGRGRPDARIAPQAAPAEPPPTRVPR